MRNIMWEIIITTCFNTNPILFKIRASACFILIRLSNQMCSILKQCLYMTKYVRAYTHTAWTDVPLTLSLLCVIWIKASIDLCYVLFCTFWFLQVEPNIKPALCLTYAFSQPAWFCVVHDQSWTKNVYAVSIW
jgi:hypothetical protein